MKKYKRVYYQSHKDKINKTHKKRRLANHDHYLKLEADRRLARSRNPKTLKVYRKIRGLSEPDRYIHDRTVGWKASAKRRNLVWELGDLDLVHLLDRQQRRCFYTGRELILKPNSRWTLSLDRLDPEKGYTKDNVVFCGALINKMKLDLTLQEFKIQLQELLACSSKWA